MMLKTNSRPMPHPAKVLAELPVGTFLKDMRTIYNSEPVIWCIAGKNHEGYPENSVTLCSNKVITLKAADGQETETPTPEGAVAPMTARYGNGRYILSNIRTWANSCAKAGEWFVKTHEYDSPPTRDRVWNNYNPYDGDAGFLTNLSPKLRETLMPTTLTTAVCPDMGGGTDICEDKIFIPSLTEMGLENIWGIPEGKNLELFSDDASRVTYPTVECVARSEYSGPLIDAAKGCIWWTRSPNSAVYTVCQVKENGKRSISNEARHSVIGFRPFCNIPSGTGVSLSPDVDGAYILFP